ncbi:MAG: DNA polymerase III subunit gamma/tau [Clostridia bacterium]|nr:DNA polymerase III subunit gamma/tau [Clostridia bacterium]
MIYQALYRKYRPKNFNEIIGQRHIVDTLANQIKANKIVHAYLFCGSRGTGKTSIAKIFARAINCENNVNGSPCEKCNVCKAMNDAANIDIIEIDAASNNRVDEIREIREKVKFMPINARYKVYIIDEVHMLTDSAYNALLKTLEEPPEHIVFILATTEPHKLPPTILSRCLRFDFGLISVEELTVHLKNIFKNERIEFDEESVKAIASAGEGSVRDTLSIADSVAAYCEGKISFEKVLDILNLNNNETLIELTNVLFKKDLGKCLEIIDRVYKQGKNMSVFAKDLSVHFRNLLVIKTCNEPNKILNLPDNLYEKFSAQAQTIESKDLMEAMKIFGNIESELKYALSPKILIETAVISLILDENIKKN